MSKIRVILLQIQAFGESIKRLDRFAVPVLTVALLRAMLVAQTDRSVNPAQAYTLRRARFADISAVWDQPQFCGATA